MFPCPRRRTGAIDQNVHVLYSIRLRRPLEIRWRARDRAPPWQRGGWRTAGQPSRSSPLDEYEPPRIAADHPEGTGTMCGANRARGSGHFTAPRSRGSVVGLRQGKRSIRPVSAAHSHSAIPLKGRRVGCAHQGVRSQRQPSRTLLQVTETYFHKLQQLIQPREPITNT